MNPTKTESLTFTMLESLDAKVNTLFTMLQPILQDDFADVKPEAVPVSSTGLNTRLSAINRSLQNLMDRVDL